MRNKLTILTLSVASLALFACHSATDQSTVTNSVLDNTVGTASDAMTNVDAVTGSAANLPADVGMENSAKPDKAEKTTKKTDTEEDSADSGDNKTK